MDNIKKIRKFILDNNLIKTRERVLIAFSGGPDSAFLFDALQFLSCENAQKEYYLTDTITIAWDRGKSVASLLIADENEVMGVNNRVELARATETIRKEILERLMLEGVTIINPKDTYIDYDVQVRKDTVIYPNTFIEGNTVFEVLHRLQVFHIADVLA